MFHRATETGKFNDQKEMSVGEEQVKTLVAPKSKV